MCIPHYREIPGGAAVPGLRGICMEQMEDGFGEALLKDGVGRDRTACYSGRVSRTQMISDRPMTAEPMSNSYLIRFLTVRQE